MGKRTWCIAVLLLFFTTLLTCKKLEIVELTKIKTGQVSDVGYTSANANSTFVDVGQGVTEYGHCWATNSAPTINDYKASVSGSPARGNFTSQISGLTANTTYYFCPYAIEDGVAIYGEIKTFSTYVIPLSVTSPNSASDWSMASKQTITWNENLAGNIQIELFKNGTSVLTIASGEPVDNKSYDWFIPIQLTAGLDYTIRITSEDDSEAFHECDNFTIQAQETGTVSDYDGNSYKTIKIGGQWWMAENLKTTHYASGKSLSDATGLGNIEHDYISKYYFNYNDNSSNVATYGRLYNWAATMENSSIEGVQGICPNGWHVPSDADWQELASELGVPESELGNEQFIGTVEAGMLKETGTTHWQSPNTGATNASGFSALPGGLRYASGIFSGLTTTGEHWTSTESSITGAWFYGFGSGSSAIYHDDERLKSTGQTVRCIKGEGTASEFTGELYLYGAASDAGTATSNAIPMKKVAERKYRLFAHLTTNSGGLMFANDLAGSTTWGENPHNAGEVSKASNRIAIAPPNEEGFYLIEVDLNNYTYRITRTVWAILGTAVYPHNWTQDVVMDYTAPYTWSVDITLLDGVFKFRANQDWGEDYDWALNLGEGSTSGTLEHGGENISVTTGGYTVSMEIHPSNGYTYTITENNNVPYIKTTFQETTWVMGTTQEITWDDNIADNVYLQLFTGNTYLSDIASNIPNNGSYNWNIPMGLEERNDYKVKVASVGANEVLDLSGQFQLTAPTGATGTVSDYDGNTYGTVKIGDQWWMAENLKSIHYSDGTALSNGSSAGDLTNDATLKYYFAPENNEANVSTYGRLYTKGAVLNGAAESDDNPSGVQGVCPTGWHLPSDAEWKELETFIGLPSGELDEFAPRGSNEGGKLKETGTTHWISPNTGATDEYQFKALPANMRQADGTYNLNGYHTFFWTCTFYRILYLDSGKIGRFGHDPGTGMSVRCLKD